MQIRPVKITITTNTSSVNINRRFSDMISTEDEMEEYEASEESPVIFVTDGVIIEDGDMVKISYDENELVKMQGAHTIFAFREKSPTTVSMLRIGSITTTLIFDSLKPRHICLYNSGAFPFEVAICTDYLSNNMTYNSGGDIVVEYSVEIRGIPEDYNRISVKVSEL